ncbi:DUF4249 family protein [Flavobacterium wongokense]|uniref:DUF4249 family protein n=1 Tax=Flavobacterium wongokense TaxID=2910674 RepID=UPI001F27FCD4|nr:DUF4249 family protein [Flavobacterium sp. WG47]MCF6132936.1 DUF4249 domain-containing protein [Flavobacterium sp. WG47]
MKSSIQYNSNKIAMSKSFLYIFSIIAIVLLTLTSCEEVVHVDLDTAAPRLVINGSIQWQKGTAGNEQKIKLTTTTGFYDPNIPTVSGAVVFVTNSDNVAFNFTEEVPNSGIYLCHNFIPEIDETYVMTVSLNGETYTATETLKSVAPITHIEQNNEGGFSGDEIEIKTYYNDPALVNNYYLYKYKASSLSIPYFGVDEDEFFQGNEFFAYFSHEDVKSGDNLDITIYGVSKRYYEYMNKLILIAEGGGGPFSTPPATVRGNIINQTNQNNYALGYFNVSETDFRNYLIQ